MKLKELLKLIPDDSEFAVEEYDNKNELIYAFWIEAKDSRADLKYVEDSTILSVHADSSVNNRKVLTVEILSSLYDKNFYGAEAKLET